MARKGFPGLRDDLRFSSPVFRHALRAALAITVAIAAAKGLGLAHSAWVPVTVLVVMRPSLGGTLQISGKRLAGTAMGAAAGLVLVCMKMPVWAAASLVLAMAFFLFYFKARHYILFTATLTICLVLIVGTVFSHTWQVAAERMADTLLGIFIGLGAAFLVWPNFARKNLRTAMGDLIAAQHRNFTQLHRAYFAEGVDGTRLVAGRLEAAKCLESCTEKFTHASVEPGLRTAQRQELANLVTCFTSIHSTLIALASTVGLPTVGKPADGESTVFYGEIRAELEGVMERIDRRFSDLEAYARDDRQAGGCQSFNVEFRRFMAFLGRMRSQGEFERFPLDTRNNAAAFLRRLSRLAAELERTRKGIEALRRGR